MLKETIKLRLFTVLLVQSGVDVAEAEGVDTDVTCNYSGRTGVNTENNRETKINYVLKR